MTVTEFLDILESWYDAIIADERGAAAIISDLDRERIIEAVERKGLLTLARGGLGGGGGGGGGGGDGDGITQSQVTAAINAAVDIDTMIAALNSIDTKTVSGITQSQVTTAINAAVDIDTMIALLSSIDNKINLAGGFSSIATITRAANTTAYIANDVYGGAFELTGVGSINSCVVLSGIRLMFNITALPSGMSGFLLYLYSATPPSAVADNGAFSVPSIDRATLLTPGGIDLGSASLAVGGGSVILQADNINIQLPVGASGSLFGYLVTRAGFTPAANSETITITALTLRA